MILSEITTKYPELGSIRMRQLTAYKSTRTVNCIISAPKNTEISSSVKSDIKSMISAKVPERFRVDVKYEIDSWTEGSVNKYILDCIAKHFVVLSNVTPSCITSVVSKDNVSVTFIIDDMQEDMFKMTDFESKFVSMWNSYTATPIEIKYNVRKFSADDLMQLAINLDKQQKISIAKHYRKPVRTVGFIGSKLLYRAKVAGGTANYINDISVGSCVVCGRISDIKVSTSSKNNLLMIHKFMLTDETASIQVVLFVRYKSLGIESIMEQLGINADEAGAMIEKNQKHNDLIDRRLNLHEGQLVVIDGECSVNDISHAKQIVCNRMQECAIVTNEEEKVSDAPTANYEVIQPVAINYGLEVQSALFGSKPKKAKIKGDYVILETIKTGTNVARDCLISVACIKISDGVIVESINSLVNVDKYIENISNYTSVSPDELLFQPTAVQIIYDIHKFCYGSTIVGSDIAADMVFLNSFADTMNCVFGNEVMPILQLASQLSEHDYASIADLLEQFNLVVEERCDCLDKAVNLAKCLVAF